MQKDLPAADGGGPAGPWLSPAVAASVLAGLAGLAATAWHLANNAAPPAWDDAWYLEVSFRLWQALKSGPLAFARAYADAFHTKAPLITLVPFPLYALFGTGERVAVWANLPLAGLAAWAWSRAASAWWSDHPDRNEAAALGGALCALIPFSYGLSRLFLVETLLCALLGLWAWRCAAGKPDDRWEGVRLGVLLGLGLLAKSTFPLVAAGFAWSGRKRLLPHAKTALLVGFALAATWYAWNFPYVAGFVWSASFGHFAQDYGNASALAARLAWASSVVSSGLSWPLAAAMAACGLAALVSRRELDVGAKACLWGLAPLLVYAASANQEARLVAPLLPVIGLLAARAAFSFDRPAARRAAQAALLAAGLWVCCDQTFLAGPARALGWNGPPSSDPGWDRAGLVTAAAAAGGPDAVAAVGLEHRNLNANNLSCLAAASGLRLSFVSLGYAQQSVEAALIRLKDKGASVLVLVEGLPESELPVFLNRANQGVALAASSGRLPAVEAGRVQLCAGVTAVVFKIGPSRAAPGALPASGRKGGSTAGGSS
ncbi:MAG: hypothetical protein HY924_08610 [Elusimicrobia bacterium]|nr:hypothetical protein [Elusimicrobiota bacterium]